MDRYSKSSEGVHQGSKVSRNSFGGNPTSTINHSTQTSDNQHVRLSHASNNSINSQQQQHQAHRQKVGNTSDSLRDAKSMATKDKVVQQQLQKSQFYQRGLQDSDHFVVVDNTPKNTENEDAAAAAVMEEDEDIDRKLDPNMYDNVQYS
ncbi:hypothetical protein BGX33_003942 [Mortierella sp. NVP41]|nr:hypothetical protein BGX33_003942 [Mortierella sp. NVP41]